MKKGVLFFCLTLVAALICACGGGSKVTLDYQKSNREYSGRLTVKENKESFCVLLAVEQNGEYKRLTFSEPEPMKGIAYIKNGEEIALHAGDHSLPLPPDSTACSLFSLFEYSPNDISAVKSSASKKDEEKTCTVLMSDNAEITLRVSDGLPLRMENEKVLFEIGS